MTTTRTGGDIVADALVAHGVRVLFTLCGGHISPILVSCKARGIRVVDVRDEATAVFAADAVSRLTRTTGVAAVTAGPGVTNAITALKNAQLAQSPLLLLGGATATILKGRGSLQDIDQVALVKPHVKSTTAVRRVADLEPALAAALTDARHGVPGPVFVECPVDLLYPESAVRELYAAGTRKDPWSIAERVTHWYLNRHLNSVFAPPRSSRAAPRSRAEASPVPGLDRLVGKAAQRLARAQRPVIVVGSQAVAGDTDVGALVGALTALDMPVFLSGMARGLLGADHPRQFRHQRKSALREADVVLLAGTPCDFRLDYGRQISRRAFLIGVNRSPEDLVRNRRPHVGAVARPDEFLVRVASQLRPAHSDSSQGAKTRGSEETTWLRALRKRESDRDGEIAERSRAAVAPTNPLQVCRAIDRQLTDNAIVVADGGDFVATASYIVRPRRPLSWLDPGVFGTLGVGAGFVLGAHASRPEAEIWAIYGDGALGFSLAEFDTFVRHKVPVVAVVGNDGKWAQIARDQVEVLKDDVGTHIGRLDYHRVVEGFGACGLVIDRPEAIDGTLEHALQVARGGTPVLVNALIGDTDFRKGSISL
jgi:acetolactate synthase-1/2/3 large subunit